MRSEIRKLEILTSQVGQGLVEAILASVVVIMVVYSLVNLGVLAMRSSNFAKDRVRADQYSSEALEALRAIRDKTNGWDGIYNLALNTPLCFQGDLTLVPVAAPCPENLESNKFERFVIVEGVERASSGPCSNGCLACGAISPGSGNTDSCTRKLNVIVAWKGPAESCPKYQSYLAAISDTERYCVSASTYLTSWR